MLLRQSSRLVLSVTRSASPHVRRATRTLAPIASISRNTVTLRYVSNAAPNTVETHKFQAETKNLMDIVAKSLYSQSEVFVRELISNASDALEKRRWAELSQGAPPADAAPYEIRVDTDAQQRLLTFTDTGIGMNKEELVSCLGTIAKSGSKDFIVNAKTQAEAESIIGQFGVGFYSAFMVAEQVTVTTRKLGESQGYCWSWDGGDLYNLTEVSNASPGTQIVLKLRPGDSAVYAEKEKLIEVIKKYSYFVSVPILVDGDRVNSLNAIWTMNPKEVTPEMHENFFKQLTKMHHPHLVNDRPQYTIHYKADSPVSLRAVMYIPSHRVSSLEFASETFDCGLSLYARRVLIKPNAKELLPRYLRFVVGVVDSEDVPLNLSREMLQNNPVLQRLKKILTEKVISYLAQQMNKDRIKYNDFYKDYALYFKEGTILEPDQGIKEEIAKLLMFESSSLKAGVMTSLGEYVDRMQEGQKEIYYIFAPSRQLAESSPYYEMVRGEGREVLFVFDPADEVVFLSLPQFRGKHLQSLEKWAEQREQTRKADAPRDAESARLATWVKDTLGSLKANEVTVSARVSEHPLVITVGAEMGAARHLMRMGQVKDQEHLVFLKPTVILHSNHPLIGALGKMSKSDPELARILLEQIYDNALITAGLLKDPSKMVGRLNKLLTDLAKQGGGKSTILTP